MEYLIALSIVSAAGWCVLLYSKGYGQYSKGYEQARKDLYVQAEINAKQTDKLIEKWKELRAYQKRLGLNVRPTLSVVTPIRNASRLQHVYELALESEANKLPER